MHNLNLVEALLHLCLLQRVAVLLLLLHPHLLLVEATEVVEALLLRLLQPIGVQRHLFLHLYSNNNSKILLLILLRWVLVL
jgi:hypothetical protein